MAINFINQDVTFSLRRKNYLKKWIKNVIHTEGNELEAVSFIFCSDKALHEMNKKYLGHDTYTDVLAFDLTDNKDDGVISGDVFISLDRVEENAKKFKTDFENELHRVMLHGLLHLLGYGDKEEDDIQMMRERENFYLSRIA